MILHFVPISSIELRKVFQITDRTAEIGVLLVYYLSLRLLVYALAELKGTSVRAVYGGSRVKTRIGTHHAFRMI